MFIICDIYLSGGSSIAWIIITAKVQNTRINHKWKLLLSSKTILLQSISLYTKSHIKKQIYKPHYVIKRKTSQTSGIIEQLFPKSCLEFLIHTIFNRTEANICQLCKNYLNRYWIHQINKLNKQRKSEAIIQFPRPKHWYNFNNSPHQSMPFERPRCPSLESNLAA